MPNLCLATNDFKWGVLLYILLYPQLQDTHVYFLNDFNKWLFFSFMSNGFLLFIKYIIAVFCVMWIYELSHRNELGQSAIFFLKLFIEDILTAAQWYYFSSNNPLVPFLIKKILFSVITVRCFNYDLATSYYWSVCPTNIDKC